MSKGNWKIYFSVFGNFDPNELDIIFPTINSIKIKDKEYFSSDLTSKYRESSWKIYTTGNNLLITNELMDFLADLFVKQEVLQRFIQSKGLKSKLSFVLYLKDVQSPSLSMPSRVINFLNDINGVVDIELYLFPSIASGIKE